MKTLRIGVALLASTLLVVLYSGTSTKAFHSGGVAECAGCHSMHSPAAGGTYLLVGSDQSSTCLTCHEAADTSANSYHISTKISGKFAAGSSPVERTPGGDFAWLKKDYAWGTADDAKEPGEMHGHNVVAADFGYEADSKNTTAPGNGNFQSSKLSCASCHDPHGQFRRNAAGQVATTGQPIYASGSYYNGTSVAANEPTANESVGVYRLLAGAGYKPYDGSAVFTGVPVAKVPSTYNRTEASTQTRVAYGIADGNGQIAWGKWCSTCHPDMHTKAAIGTNYVHPVDESLGGTVAGNYNKYIKTGDWTGTSANSFSSLAPFAKSGTYAQLAALAVNTGSMPGPTDNDEVTCLSCHRAHASGTMHALRFDIEYEFMTKGGEYTGTDNPLVGTTGRGPIQARGRLISEWKAHYYDRPASQFATYQRVLCNKCHAKD